MPRRMQRRHRFRRRDTPSVSSVTYSQVLQMSLQTTQANQTVSTIQDVSNVSNTSGETVNRKILRVTGNLAFAAQPSAGSTIVTMFALWAHPIATDPEILTDFDPFGGEGPGKPGFEGRPLPRPFGRRLFAHTLQPGGTATQIFEELRYHTKAERLLRPGWKLSAGLWCRCATSGSHQTQIGGGLRVVVAG